MKGSPCQIRCEGLFWVHLAPRPEPTSSRVRVSPRRHSGPRLPPIVICPSLSLSIQQSAWRKLTSSFHILPPSITPGRSEGSRVEGDSQGKVKRISVSKSRVLPPIRITCRALEDIPKENKRNRPCVRTVRASVGSIMGLVWVSSVTVISVQRTSVCRQICPHPGSRPGCAVSASAPVSG